MSDSDPVSRLDFEERHFGPTLVRVGTHSGRVHVTGPHLDNFRLDNAVEWVCHVLNGWDIRPDPAAVRRTLMTHNMRSARK